ESVDERLERCFGVDNQISSTLLQPTSGFASTLEHHAECPDRRGGLRDVLACREGKRKRIRLGRGGSGQVCFGQRSLPARQGLPLQQQALRFDNALFASG